MSAAGSDLSNGPSLLDPRWDVPGKPAVLLRYAIIGSEVTGSPALSRRMRDFGLGLPFPYLEQDVVPKLATRLGCWDMYGNMQTDEYLSHLASVRTTANGVFGLEVSMMTARNFTRAEPDRPGKFWRNFDKIILLRRRDKAMQAVAIWRRWLQPAATDSAGGNPERRDALSGVAEALGFVMGGERIAAQMATRSGPERLRMFDYDAIDDAASLADLTRWLVDGRTVAPVQPDGLMPLLQPPPPEDVELRRNLLAYIAGERFDSAVDARGATPPAGG